MCRVSHKYIATRHAQVHHHLTNVDNQLVYNIGKLAQKPIRKAIYAAARSVRASFDHETGPL